MAAPEIENIQSIMESLPAWEFLQQLPRRLHGFTFHEGGRLDGHVLTLCSYVNETTHCRLDLIYTKETFDYMPVRFVGLQSYRDVRYITRDKGRFAEIVRENLSEMLATLRPDAPQKGVEYILRRKGIIDWEYGRKLPKRIGNFELFISPDHPLEYINNSIIFIDYSDFVCGNQLVFLYNQVKNEFFAENKRNFIPGTIHDFDCNDLKDVEQLLQKNLQQYLESLGRE